MDTDAIMAMTRMENDETSPAGKSRIPNAETKAAMQEVREIMRQKQAVTEPERQSHPLTGAMQGPFSLLDDIFDGDKEIADMFEDKDQMSLGT